MRAPDKLDGRNPFTTVGVDYSSDPRDPGEHPAHRRRSDPPRPKLHEVSDFDGAIGSARSCRCTRARISSSCRATRRSSRTTSPADQRTIAIVDEDSPTHCGFTDAEGLAGWEALRAWKDGAPQPDVADLQQMCDTLVSSDDITGPCRFDANPTVVPFDDIVRPRPADAPGPPGHSRHAHPSGPPTPERTRASENARGTAALER